MLHPIGQEYPYNTRWSNLVAGYIFFGTAALIAFVHAQTNQRGLNIEGVIRLSREDTTIFFYVLSAASFGFVVASIAGAFVRVSKPQKLVLTDSGLYAHRWVWSWEPNFIRYGDIRSVSRTRVRGRKFLTIVHDYGKHHISPSRFASEQEFEKFCSSLAERMAPRSRRA